jgi:hypothetical protein
MPRHPDCRDPEGYEQAIHSLSEFFTLPSDALNDMKVLAGKIREGIERISPFIQQATQATCPSCKEVCCISKHGHYLYEDLVYLLALGLHPPPHIFGKPDSDPCQYLSQTGCILERSIRPSGCNWYFCDALLDNMEKNRGYETFDDSLRDVADLWLKMMEEFGRISPDP